MRQQIPAPVIAACAEILSQRNTHASLDNLFMYAGAPGEPPEGSKWVKAQEWIRRVNNDTSVQPLKVLGRLIEVYMEEEPPESGPFDDSASTAETPDQQKIRKALARYDLQYARGGSITGTLGTPSRTLEDFIRERDLPAIDQEFTRALSNVDQSPREAVSAASNILESVCKIYIADLHDLRPSLDFLQHLDDLFVRKLRLLHVELLSGKLYLPPSSLFEVATGPSEEFNGSSRVWKAVR